MKKTHITFCSSPDYSSSAKALYEYIIKRYKDNFNYTWVVREDKSVKKLKEKNINVININSKSMNKHMKNTDIVFTTHTELIDFKTPNNLYIELWHGFSSKVSGFLLDLNINDLDFQWLQRLRRKVDYFIVPSKFWQVIFSARYNMLKDQILPLGCPKLDYYKYSNGKKNLSKLLGINVDDYNKIIFYSPTFRKVKTYNKNNVNLENIINIDEYDENELYSYLKKKNYLLCVSRHPSENNIVKAIDNDHIKNISLESMQESEISISEIINAANLLITDYGSLGTEFLFLNKPVIYINKDFNNYNKKRGITFDNHEFWTPGFKVSNLIDLEKAVNNSFDKNFLYKNALEEKKKMFYGDLKDGGCKKICDKIFSNDGKIILEKNIKKDIILEDDMKPFLEKKDKEINQLKFQLDEKNKELYIIKNSKLWVLAEKLRKIKNKLN